MHDTQDKQYLSIHMNTHEKTSISCEMCESMFQSKNDLSAHRKVHKETLVFQCSLCENNYSSIPQVSTQEFIEDSRTRRKLKQSGKEDKVKCDQCEWKTGSITLLNKHKTTIHDKDQANKNLKSNYTSKRIKCEECDKKFNKNETYRKHMTSIHNETEENSNQTKPDQVMTFLR